MAKIIFIEKNGNELEVEAPIGLSLLAIARQNCLEIEGSCGGCMACAACHVVVDPAWADKLETISDDEEDVLELARGATKTSRLSCQLLMTEELNGIRIALPGAPTPWEG